MDIKKQYGKFSGVFVAFLLLASFLLEWFFMVRVMVQQGTAGSLGLGCGEQQGLPGDSKAESHSQSCPSPQHWTAPAQAGGGTPGSDLNGVWGPRQG